MNEIVKTNNTELVSANASDFSIPRGYICTLNLDDIEGKIKLAAAINGAVSMKDKSGEVLRVVDIVTTQGVRSRTGEECTNSYLITDDDTVYFTQSDGVARSLKVLVAAFTDRETGRFTSPVNLGVGFQITEEKLDNGNTLKKIIPVKLA